MSGIALRFGAAGPQRLLLVASLALNLFFVGAAVSIAIQQSRVPVADAPLDRSPAARIDRLAATLPGPDAKLVYAQFQAAEPAIEAGRLASRAAQEKVRRILKTEPFDIGAADDALSSLRDARRAVWLTLHAALVRAAADMSPEGRARLADWVPPNDGRPAPPSPH